MHIRAFNKTEHSISRQKEDKYPPKQIINFYQFLLKEKKLNHKHYYFQGISKKEPISLSGIDLKKDISETHVKQDISGRMKMNKLREVKSRNRLKQKVKQRVKQQLLEAIKGEKIVQLSRNQIPKPLKTCRPYFAQKNFVNNRAQYTSPQKSRKKDEKKEKSWENLKRKYSKSKSQNSSVLDLAGINLKHPQQKRLKGTQISHLLSYKINQTVRNQMNSLKKKSIEHHEKQQQKSLEKKRRKTVVSIRKRDIQMKKIENIQPWAIKTDFQEEQEEMIF